jgi:saccharopine dehydrogenase-like NADP-dependent oxidoreductase
MLKKTIVIAGSGGMGSAVALLLRELGDFEVDLFLGDCDAERAHQTANWVREGSSQPGEVRSFLMPEAGINTELEEALAKSDLLLDCLPGKEAPRMAGLARKHRLHYANLTEHVRETEEIQEIADGADRGFLLQTGLAPGYVNVLANHLYEKFQREHGTDRLEVMEMRVGALTRTARPPHYYGFTWSSIGVATEYVEPATVVRDHEIVQLPSLTDLKPVLIDGERYEEALTSGGAADLPASYAGKVRHLDYKTLRYPGHYDWVQSLLAEADSAGEDRAVFLQKRMEELVPFADDDIVVIHAAVEGHAADGTLRRLEETRKVPPRRVGARVLKAIQATTAAGLAESARLLLLEEPQGVCLQSQIDTQRFLHGPFVSTLY